MNDLEILKKVGFTDGEVRVYSALLSLGSSTTGPIIEKSHITSSKVYYILERLEERGLVSHVIRNNVRIFQASDPKRLTEYMNEKINSLKKDKADIDSLIPLLEQKRSLFQTQQETTMYQGVKGFESALKELAYDLKSGEEFVVFGAKRYFGKSFERFLKHFYIEKDAKGIKTRLIYNEGFRDIMDLYDNLEHTSVRFIDKIMPSSIALSKNKILLVSYGETARQVLIHSPDIASSFYAFFESMWDIAKE